MPDAPDPSHDRDQRRQVLDGLLVNLADQLTRLIDDAPRPAPGALQLPPGACRQLEVMTGIGTTRSAADLLRAVERLASISIGDIRIEFTPGQLEELKHRAVKRGRTLAEEMRAVVSRVEDEVFHHGG